MNVQTGFQKTHQQRQQQKRPSLQKQQKPQPFSGQHKRKHCRQNLRHTHRTDEDGGRYLFDSDSRNHLKFDLLLKQNRAADAEKALEALLKSRPDDPDVWYQVAETRGLSGNIIGLHQARAEYFALVGDYRQAIQQLDFAKRKAGSNFPLSSRIDARQRKLMEQERMIKDMMG